MKYSSINVIIVTYRQQDLIGRTLDSILSQKEYGLKEIIVCDDCSPDNNWDVIMSYVKKYPETIRAYRNEKNLGIYGNANKALSLRGEAELYYFMAGDDELNDGWFKHTQEYIAVNNIDVAQPIAIFADWVNIDPEGRRVVMKRNLSVKDDNRMVGLFLRNKLSLRSTLVSSSAWKEIKEVDLSKGVGFAESIFELQRIAGIKKPYYMDYVGSAYYSGIGVSAHLESFDPCYFTEGALESQKYILNRYATRKEDIDYIKGQIAGTIFIMSLNVGKLLASMFLYIKGMRSYGFRWREFISFYKYVIYLALKRIRHDE